MGNEGYLEIPIMPPTFGSETYRSTNPREVIRPGGTVPYFLRPESIMGPDTIPEISRLQPASAVINSGDFQVTLIGLGFLRTSVILWNNAEIATTYTNPNTLKATIKSSAVTDSIQVVVRNNKTISLARTFTFTATAE